MIRVVIESPYAGDVEKNHRYLRASMKRSRRKTIDCLPDDEGTFEDWQQACKDMDKAFVERVVAVHGGAA